MTPESRAVLNEDLVRAAAAAAPITASSRTDDLPASWDERTVLTTMLDYVRDTVHVKCAGLTDEQARRAPLPGSPLTTISGLVSHVRWVDYYWIRVVLLGEEKHSPSTADDPDAEMRLALEITAQRPHRHPPRDGRRRHRPLRPAPSKTFFPNGPWCLP